MALALDEEHCGIDTEIIYPNVQSCIALAVGTSGGTLAGMHLTIGTSADQVRRAAAVLQPHLVGVPDSIVCIGNMATFRTATGGLTFPGALRNALRDSFAATCDVDFLDSSVLYEATRQGALGGVVVRAWRDSQSHKLRYAMGPHTSATKAAKAAMNTPWFKVSSMKNTDLTGKQGDTYTLTNMRDVPVLGLATM